MAQETVQILYCHAEAAGAAPRRTVFQAVTRALIAPLLWLATINQRSRMRLHLQDLPPDIRRDLGFRENGGQSGLQGGWNVRFPDWS